MYALYSISFKVGSVMYYGSPALFDVIETLVKYTLGVCIVFHSTESLECRFILPWQ